METPASLSHSLFPGFFCIGMAIVTTIEVFMAYPTLLRSNKKQKLLGIRQVPRLEKKTFLIFSFILVSVLIAVGFEFIPTLYLLICMLLYFLVYGQLQYLGRKTNLYPFMLLFFAANPLLQKEAISFTADTWTLLFAKTTLSFVYLSSFIQKMKNAGLSWAKKNKMKEIISYHDLLNETNWLTKFNRYPFLFQLMGKGTLFFEAFFWISLFFPHYDFLFGVIAIMFHTSTLILFRINYLLYYIPVLIMYFL